MVGVFGIFALGRRFGLQQTGLGLGVAVLIDATLIGSKLLPASMKLLCNRIRENPLDLRAQNCTGFAWVRSYVSTALTVRCV